MAHPVMATPALGTSWRQQSGPRVGWSLCLKSAVEKTRDARQPRDRWGFQGNFGQVLTLSKTSRSFSICSPILEGLATSRIMVIAWSVKNTHPIICWAMFILFFLLAANSPGRHRTTHLNETSWPGNMVLLFSPAFSQKVPWKGSDLPFKGVS